MVRDLERLAYESAVAALQHQGRVLDELRSRTGLLLATSSLATSFLGGRAISEGDRAVVAIGLVAFAATVAACVVVLVPQRDTFTAALNGPAVYEELFPFRDDPEEVHRRLVYQLHRFWEENDRQVQPLFVAFRVASAGLVVQVVLLAASVGGTLG